MKPWVRLFLAVMAFALLAWDAKADDVSLRQTAHAATEAFRNGQFARASELYHQLYTTHHVANGELFYNLGNALTRQGNMPAALAAYKAAQFFLPRDADVAANLEFARRSKTDNIEEKPDYLRLFLFWLDWASLSEYLMLASLACALFFASLCLQRINPKRSPLWLRTILGVGALFFTFSFATRWLGLTEREEAVVSSAEVAVKSADTADGITLFVLHAGTEVFLGKRRGTWIQIELADGKRGWVMQNALITYL